MRGRKRDKMAEAYVEQRLAGADPVAAAESVGLASGALVGAPSKPSAINFLPSQVNVIDGNVDFTGVPLDELTWGLVALAAEDYPGGIMFLPRGGLRQVAVEAVRRAYNVLLSEEDESDIGAYGPGVARDLLLELTRKNGYSLTHVQQAWESAVAFEKARREAQKELADG